MTAYTEEATGRSVTIGGIHIHYNDAGQGEPIIMLHGSGPGASGWSNFSRNVDALAATRRVLLFDMPGWGGSDPRERGIDFLAWFADKVVGFMDALDIPNAHLVGNSLGGAVAVKLALEHPHRVDRLVLMGAPVGFGLFGDAFTPAIRDIIFFYEGEGPSLEKLKSFADKFVFDRAAITDELLEQRLESAMNFKDNPPMRLGPGDRMEALWQHPDFRALPHQILMIFGREDRVVPLDRGLSVLTQLPNARLLVLPNCGHWAQWEHAEEFNQVVAGFLAK